MYYIATNGQACMKEAKLLWAKMVQDSLTITRPQGNCKEISLVSIGCSNDDLDSIHPHQTLVDVTKLPWHSIPLSIFWAESNTFMDSDGKWLSNRSRPLCKTLARLGNTEACYGSIPYTDDLLYSGSNLSIIHNRHKGIRRRSILLLQPHSLSHLKTRIYRVLRWCPTMSLV